MNKNNCTKTLSGYHAWNRYYAGVDVERTEEIRKVHAKNGSLMSVGYVPRYFTKCDACGMINDLETKTPNLSVEPLCEQVV